jgi:hypothetical protein
VQHLFTLTMPWNQVIVNCILMWVVTATLCLKVHVDIVGNRGHGYYASIKVTGKTNCQVVLFNVDPLREM